MSQISRRSHPSRRVGTLTGGELPPEFRSGAHGGDPLVVEWFVDLAGDPESMQEHSEFSGNGHDRSPFRFFRSWAHDLLAVAFEVTVDAAFAENAMRTLHQQAPYLPVAGFGDTPVRIAASGLLLAGGETEVRADDCGGIGWDSRWRE